MAHSNAPPIACWVKSRWQVQYSHVILRRARRRTWSRSRSKINVQRDRECSTRVLYMTHRLWSRSEVESVGSDPNLCPSPTRSFKPKEDPSAHKDLIIDQDTKITISSSKILLRKSDDSRLCMNHGEIPRWWLHYNARLLAVVLNQKDILKMIFLDFKCIFCNFDSFILTYTLKV